jgi:hypothetical protein
MNKNNEILENFFHIINFLYFAREQFLLLKNEETKKTKLKQISMLADWSIDFSIRYKKNGNNFTYDELKYFLKIYQTCSLIYDLNFRQLIGGKQFHLQFNYSSTPKT